MIEKGILGSYAGMFKTSFLNNTTRDYAAYILNDFCICYFVCINSRRWSWIQDEAYRTRTCISHWRMPPCHYEMQYFIRMQRHYWYKFAEFPSTQEFKLGYIKTSIHRSRNQHFLNQQRSNRTTKQKTTRHESSSRFSSIFISIYVNLTFTQHLLLFEKLKILSIVSNRLC